jgi:putative transcriptional regulator
MSKRIHESDIFKAIQTSAKALHKVDAINKATMRDFNLSCLSTPPAFAPEEIQRLRKANHVSQPMFARYLNTSESTVENWETGAKRPSGTALKLLTIVQKHGLQTLA